MTDFIIGIFPENSIDRTLLSIGYNGQVKKDKVFLYGNGVDFYKWIYVVVHELYHVILFENEVDSKFHHTIIDLL